eukprot:jgi/Tetstr1/426344/TSEL_016657.t1
MPGFENGMPADSLRRPGLFPIGLDRVLEYPFGNPPLQPAADECYHAACYGAFIAGSAMGLRMLTPAAHMHHGDTFALNVVRKRYLRPITENLGPHEFTELLELYQDRVYDANIASAAKTTARLRIGSILRRNYRGREGSGGSRKNFKTSKPGARGVAPRANFAKDVTKDVGKGKAKAEIHTVDRAE